jgi:hypothetical protein
MGDRCDNGMSKTDAVAHISVESGSGEIYA